MPRFVLIAALALVAVFHPASAQESSLGLPSPPEFYRTYNVESEGKQLYKQFLESLDPQSRILISKLVEESSTSGVPDIPKVQAKLFVQSLNWREKKRALLDQLLFRSQVLDVIPASSKKLWTPIVHDALVFFFGSLSDDRLFDLAWNVAHMPPNATRGEKIVALANRVPTLQKLAQMLARSPDIAPDIRVGLQTLENSIRTTSRADLVSQVTAALGEQKVRDLKLEFADKVLAEASVGAVIRAKAVPPGEESAVDVVVKVVKPYALSDLPEEMTILDHMTAYFEREAKFYHIDDAPITDIFRDLRGAWEQELEVQKEQAHFREAAAYYAHNPYVKIPRLIEATPQVTIMEFIDGEKITNAFQGDAGRRAIMARRLYDTMSLEPIYGKHDTSVFHGDPHAGNVFHVLHNKKDPYQIALLDWGLMGEFGRAQRRQIVQLFLGLEYKDRKRMANGLGGLIVGGLPADPAKRRRTDEIFDQVLEMKNTKSGFENLGELIRLLTLEGCKVEPEFGLFIKAQLTIAGILTELDPQLNQMAYGRKHVMRLVLRELPKRLLLLPAWNYHGYRSMMSNQDVLRGIF